ncbi:MAG: FUSC family protein [Cyclobacteriaceae bacterium]|jgi:hypothetical protein
MANKELAELTDQELLEEAKKMKSFSFTNALFIGFLAGVIIYSVAKSSWGMLTLIPLYLIYKLVNDPKNKRSKDLEQLLKEQNCNFVDYRVQ